MSAAWDSPVVVCGHASTRAVAVRAWIFCLILSASRMLCEQRHLDNAQGDESTSVHRFPRQLAGRMRAERAVVRPQRVSVHHVVFSYSVSALVTFGQFIVRRYFPERVLASASCQTCKAWRCELFSDAPNLP